MPRYLVNIGSEEERRANRLVEQGVYRDVEHLISVALRNQLIAEEEGLNPWQTGESPPAMGEKTGPSRERGVGHWRFGGVPEIRFFPSKPLEIPVTLPEPPDGRLAGTLLWAQFYRFLPLKVAGRVLFWMTQAELAPWEDYVEESVRTAVQMYSILRSYDSALGLPSGERLSTSFPKTTEKSQSRFRDHFLPHVRPTDELLDGFLVRMKFASVVKANGDFRVGLTRRGVDYVKLHNPVLDEESPDGRSLSEEEAAFILSHIHAHLPDEYRHVVALLEAIAEGADTPDALDRAMRSFYVNLLDEGHTWTEAHISAMRGGVQSRARELGLVDFSRRGRRVTYSVTARGRALIEEGLPAVSHAGAGSEQG